MMKNTHRAQIFQVFFRGALVLLVSQASAQTVPVDAKPVCTVSANDFKKSFETGSVSLNGIVKPPDSVNFPDVPNCSFYQWSEQTFLWLTSPSGADRIFSSSMFFDVSPDDGTGRQLVPHTPGMLPQPMSLRSAQPGPNGLPVVVTAGGKLVEFVVPPTDPSGKPLIQDNKGKFVAVDRLSLQDNEVIFFDRNGNKIDYKRADNGAVGEKTNIARRFEVGEAVVFVDASGNVIETEEGQAGGGQVLQAQKGSLIYYMISVNDVFAYLRTGAQDGGITPKPSKLPTTMDDLSKITAFAAAHGKELSDANALAVEIKTSWVEAAMLVNPADYILIDAKVPTYDKANPKLWIASAPKTTKLALVGIHVVGSAKGHPELIWATFEHVGNTPNGTYSYTTAENEKKAVSQMTTGEWLFCANSSAGPFNRAHMAVVHGRPHDIQGSVIDKQKPDERFSISPSDTLRMQPWGAALNSAPNPIAGSDTASNTEIISINNSVREQLAKGDVRANYILIGATWTIGGADPDLGNQVGTSQLANSTMETYQQRKNCFDCHDASTTSGSQVYDKIKPLF